MMLLKTKTKQISIVVASIAHGVQTIRRAVLHATAKVVSVVLTYAKVIISSAVIY